MRKVLSFVLVLSLVLGSFSFAFAGAGDLTDISGKTCEDAVNVLSELEVVTGYPDGSYKPENIVTRAEMAVIIIKAMGLEGFAAGSKSNFKDMAGYDWAQSYVGYAQSRGIIAGYPDGTFKPAQTVSYNEAAKMLVAAVGYPLSVLQGVWPANYVNKAQDLGILDGIAASAAGANRADIAVMTYQTLDVPMVRVDNENRIIMLEGEWNNVLGAYDAVTMMTKLGVEDYDQDGAIPVADKGKFVVNGDEDSVINLRPYVGKLVTAYQNDDGEILAIKEVKSTTLTGEYDAGDEILDVNGVEYTFDAATTKTDIDAVAAGIQNYVGAGYFTNGGDTPGAFPAAFAGLIGAGANQFVDGDMITVSADVSGKKIKDLYSVAEWDVTEDDYWDAEFAAEVKDDKSLMNVDFALDDDDNIDSDSYHLLGATDFASIPNDAVVYVYKGVVDGDNVITKVEVGTKVVTGEITKVNSLTTKYTINGVTYEIADDYVGTLPDAKDEVKLFLDYSGYIYDNEKISGDADKVAVILNYKNGTVGSLGDDPQIELLLADGTKKSFDVDYDEVTTDNTVFTVLQTNGAGTVYEWSDAAATVAGQVDYGDLVEYDVDSDGKIVAIDLFAKTTATKAITASGTFNGFNIASDAVIFTYQGTAPNTMANVSTENAAVTALDDDDFGVTTLDKVLDTDAVLAYYYHEDGVLTKKIAAMVIDSGATSDEEFYGVLTGKGTNSSTAGKYADLLIDGKEVTYNTKAALAGINEGTVVAGVITTMLYRCEFDTNGNVELTNAATAPDYFTGSAVGTDTNNNEIGFSLNVNSSNVVTYVAANNKEAADAALVEAGAANLRVSTGFTLASDCDIYVWNFAEGAFELGTKADLKENDLWTVKFFDCDTTAADRDGLVDVVLIYQTDADNV